MIQAGTAIGTAITTATATGTGTATATATATGRPAETGRLAATTTAGQTIAATITDGKGKLAVPPSCVWQFPRCHRYVSAVCWVETIIHA